jgi:Tol biopolymer transport system component
VLLESSDEKTVLDWSPDGKLVFYSVLNPKTNRDLWMLPLAGGVRTPQLFLGTPANDDAVQLSPDGRWILYRSGESGQSELYVQPFPPTGLKWLISKSGVQDFQWRPDGREIYFVSQGKIQAVEVQVSSTTFQPGAPKELFPMPVSRNLGRGRFVVSHDGQRFLIIAAEEERDVRDVPFVVILNWPRLLENQ